MRKLKDLFENNRAWALKKLKADPEIFTKLLDKQTPHYLWIGCSDSRIPANEILGLEPGDLFVHRNVANLFLHTDFNSLSVLQYAVEYLHVKDVIVCGHYGCGGVAAAMGKAQLGLVDNWLRTIRDIYQREKEQLGQLSDPDEKYKRLVELNVLHQVMNICHTTIVQNAWAAGKRLAVHGWIYDLSNGLLKDLDCCISSPDQIEETHRTLKLH